MRGVRDRAAYRREILDAIRNTERHLAHLQAELQDVEEKYVQVRFLEGFNEWTEPSSALYTYVDPSGCLNVGDYVLAGFKNAIAVVEKLGKGNYEGFVKPINYRLVSQAIC